MIASLVIAAMLAAAPANPTNAPRKAYLACLDKTLRASLEAKTPPGDFEKALDPTCAAEEAAFRKAFIAYDAVDGISAKESNEVVTDEINDFKGNTTEMYREYMSSGTRPV